VEHALAYWYITPQVVSSISISGAGICWKRVRFFPHTESVNNVITTYNTDLVLRYIPKP
jgi:hypothetical protein